MNITNELFYMSTARQRLHEMIDKNSDEKLSEVFDLLSRFYEEEEEGLSESELRKIVLAKERIAKGDYATFDEVFADLE